MSTKKKDDSTDLVVRTHEGGILEPDEQDEAISRFFDGGFAEDRQFWIGDPGAGGKKVPYYVGQMIGRGEPILIDRVGATPNPETGEIPQSEIPTFLFWPVNPDTLEPNSKIIDTIMCNDAVARACAKYLALAAAQGGLAQLFFRWMGKEQTRKGNQRNDVRIMFRVVSKGAVKVTDVVAEPVTPNGSGKGANDAPDQG